MLGVPWWLLYLRPRLAAGKVGIARTKDPGLGAQSVDE
jgi:hypothetical protein